MAFINLEKCEEKREGHNMAEEVEVDSERDGKTWKYKLDMIWLPKFIL